MNNEDDTIDRKVMMAGNNEFKSYFYLENGVIVKEHHVKIENGIEIPYDKAGSTKYFLEIPQNIEEAKILKVFDAETGHVSNELIKEEICFLKIFNQTKNIGEIHKVVNGIDTEVRFYKIENGKEVYCPHPENDERKFFVPMPENLNEGDLSIYDEGGTLLRKIGIVNWQSKVPLATHLERINERIDIKCLNM